MRDWMVRIDTRLRAGVETAAREDRRSMTQTISYLLDRALAERVLHASGRHGLVEAERRRPR
jgi:hypothetical protein